MAEINRVHDTVTTNRLRADIFFRFSGTCAELHESFLFNPDTYNSCDEEAPPFMTPLVPLHELHRTLSRRVMNCLAFSVGKYCHQTVVMALAEMNTSGT